MIRVIYLWLAGNMFAYIVNAHWYFYLAYFLAFLSTFAIHALSDGGEQ